MRALASSRKIWRCGWDRIRLGRRGRGLVLRRHAVAGAGILHGSGLRGLLAPALQVGLGKARGVELETRPDLGAARGQIGVDDLPGIGGFELGQERTLRVGCDRRDRARSRAPPGAEAEPVEGKRRFPGVEGHDVAPVDAPQWLRQS